MISHKNEPMIRCDRTKGVATAIQTVAKLQRA
jgi:hypothetical protein